jgi:hypothetical protein
MAAVKRYHVNRRAMSADRFSYQIQQVPGDKNPLDASHLAAKSDRFESSGTRQRHTATVKLRHFAATT